MTYMHKILKLTAFIMLGISMLPWIYTLICSIYNTFAGFPFLFSTVYGIGAFLGTWVKSFSDIWTIYVAALVMTVISMIIAVIVISTELGNKHTDEKENNDAESDNDVRKDMQR